MVVCVGVFTTAGLYLYVFEYVFERIRVLEWSREGVFLGVFFPRVRV